MNGGEAVVDDSVKNAVNICKFITLSGRAPIIAIYADWFS